MTKKLYITFALLGSLLITSCDSFLDIQPIGKVIPNTLSEYRALLTEAYSQPLFDRGVTEFRTDEVTIRDNEYDQNYYSEIEKWNDSNPIPGTREFAWSNYYSIIYYANAIIDNRDKITEGTQEDIDQLVGEAYLLRGYMHFLLVNLYGQPYTKDGAPETKAIPIKLDIDLEKTPSRNTVSEVYTAILNDIESARKLIHCKEWEKQYSYRFSTISVDAMESRVYLYMEKWQETYNSAEKVLSQKSSLEDFNKENSKIPNDFQSTEVITAYEYVCKDVDKAFRATPMLKEKYDRNDLRPNKYFDVADKNGNFPVLKCGSTQFSCSFRTGEIYLNAAEASFELGDEDPGALFYINKLRERAGFPANSLTSLTLEKIQNERRVEMAFEDQRYFDLKRWRIADDVWDGDESENSTAVVYGLYPYRIAKAKPGTNDTDKYIFVKHRSSRFILARMFRMSNYYSSIADDVINNNPLIVKNPLQ